MKKGERRRPWSEKWKKTKRRERGIELQFPPLHKLSNVERESVERREDETRAGGEKESDMKRVGSHKWILASHFIHDVNEINIA